MNVVIGTLEVVGTLVALVVGVTVLAVAVELGKACRLTPEQANTNQSNNLQAAVYSIAIIGAIVGFLAFVAK